MKVRLMKRYMEWIESPYYEVDRWVHLLGPIGYWSTKLRTFDYTHAISVYEEYKNNSAQARKTEVLAIHGDHNERTNA